MHMEQLPPSYDEVMGIASQRSYPVSPIQQIHNTTIPPVSPHITSQSTDPAQVVIVVQQPSLNSRPTRMICPHCAADVKTKVTAKTGIKTKIISLILCLVTLPICCCCVGALPMICMQNKKHYCPACNRCIGEFDPYTQDVRFIRQ